MADSERATAEVVEPVEFSVEKEKAHFVAQPLVTEKLYKKLEKIMKAAIQIHACSRGVKEVTKTLRKKQKGCDALPRDPCPPSSKQRCRFCLIAGDCTPIDVIAHLPVYCEDRSVPYAFIPTRRLLGASIESLRGTSCIMIHPTTRKKKDLASKDVASYEVLYKKLLKKMRALQSMPSS